MPVKIILDKINLPLQRNRKNKIRKSRLGPKFWRSKLTCRCSGIMYKLQKKALRIILDENISIQILAGKANTFIKISGATYLGRSPPHDLI